MSDDPDPGHMARFCREVLPGMLVDACGVAPPDAGRVARDVLSRAETAARLDRDSCEILAAPFFEELQAPAIVIDVCPATDSVQAGGTATLTATVANTANAAVAWEVNGLVGGNAIVRHVGKSLIALHGDSSAIPPSTTERAAPGNLGDPRPERAARGVEGPVLLPEGQEDLLDDVLGGGPVDDP